MPVDFEVAPSNTCVSGTAVALQQRRHPSAQFPSRFLIMSAPILLLSLPVVVALILMLAWKKPAQFFAGAIRLNPNIRRGSAVGLLALGALGTLGVDMLDISDIFTGDATLHRNELKVFEEDLDRIYGVKGGMLDSAKRRLSVIVEGLKKPQSAFATNVVSLGVGICAASYLLITWWIVGAERLLADKIVELEKSYTALQASTSTQLADAEKSKGEYRARCERAIKIRSQIERILVTKTKRIEDCLAKHQAGENGGDRTQVAKQAFRAEEQWHAFCLAIHAMLKREDIDQARLCVSLYIPSGQFLRVVASTDGVSANVITEPNTRYSEYFRLDTARPQCRAVEAYYQREPLVLSTCNEDSLPPFAGQKHDLRSIVACPLFYITGPTIGLLFAESDAGGYFPSDDSYKSYLKDVSAQVALRMTLEESLRKLAN